MCNFDILRYIPIPTNIGADAKVPPVITDRPTEFKYFPDLSPSPLETPLNDSHPDSIRIIV